jgi:hypothetical protein
MMWFRETRLYRELLDGSRILLLVRLDGLRERDVRSFKR